MAEDDTGKRLERALEEGRDWLERSAEDVVKRLGHAWRHARAFGDGDGDGDGDGGSAESKAPADLFEESETGCRRAVLTRTPARTRRALARQHPLGSCVGKGVTTE